jgi:predicted metal-dependent hydrolase
MTAAERDAHVAHARALFNAGQYWRAHEVLETVWRSIIRSESHGSAEARVWQGFIQAAAALLHRERGNRHGVETVGGAALEKLSGPQHPAVELDMVQFRAQLARALTGKGDPPHLEYRTDG